MQKFHAPGLAPVRDSSGAYHIRPSGEDAYQHRFIQTWGFYEGRAAVEAEEGWLHILTDGSPLSEGRFDWCGNFQEGRCAVRFSGSSYGHIGADGRPVYEQRHLYAGDFKDGIAVVRYAADGFCGHIDGSGRAVHARRYLDLDVFHKGYARARDEQGWFHARRDGSPAYERRFAAIEPFYNGQALCETLQGDRLVVSESAEDVERVVGKHQAHPCRRVLLIGNIGAGKTTIGKRLATELAQPLVTIDDARRACGDGTSVGEAAAWAYFLRLATTTANNIVEFSGSGPLAPLLGQQFTQSHDDVMVLWLSASPTTCSQRIAERGLAVPYPDFGVSIDHVVADLHGRLHREISETQLWAGHPVRIIDAEQSAESAFSQALRALQDWPSGTGDDR